MVEEKAISLNKIMALSQDIAFTLDISGNFIFVYENCEELLGYKADELIHHNISKFTANNKNDIVELLKEIQNSKSVKNYSFLFIHKNENRLPLKTKIQFDKNTEIIYCLSRKEEFEDTDNINKSQILQSPISLINNTNNLIWSIDKDYKILAFNKSMKDRFKSNLYYDLSVGVNMLEIPHLTEEYVKIWKDLYDRCFKGEEINVEIAPNGNPEIEEAWILANLTPIYEDKNIIGLVCHSTDITHKKQIENEQFKRYELIQNIIDHIPLGVAVNIISTGQQVMMNKKFSETYGWEEKDLKDVNAFFKKVYPDPTYRHEMIAKVMGDIATGDVNKMQWNEIRVTTKTGDTKYIDAKNIPLSELDLMISTVQDVTEKVKTKFEIQKALADKKNILESISDAFYALDKDYNFTYLNKSAQKLLNRNENELLGKNLFKEFPELSETVFKGYLEKVKKSSKLAQFEFYFPPFKIWFDECIYPSKEGFSIYFKDITERKIIQEELENAYEKENEILESISDAFLAVDNDYNFIYLNKKAEKLLNLQKTNAIGRNMWDIFDYTKDSIAAKEYNLAIKNNETRSFDFYNDVLKVWFNIRAYPSKNGLSIYFTDITHEKEHQKKLEALNLKLKKYTKKLEESNQELEQFAYIASHDLQEPLRMVSSFMEQLQNKYEDQLDDKAQTYINFAVDGAKRMRQIIIDLLEYSRAGNQEENLEQLDFNEELSEVLSLLHTSLTEKKVDLNVDELPSVLFSKTAIRQVFHNLIGNAIKYTLKDQSIKIDISWKEDKRFFIFRIQDNGIGIDEKYHDKIFQIFQRLHSKSSYSGTGLGLAICKKILKKYGGDIWVESKVGEGSSFFFSIPKKIKL